MKIKLFAKTKRFRFTYKNFREGLVYYNDIFAKTEADAVAKFMYYHPYFNVGYKLEVIDE